MQKIVIWKNKISSKNDYLSVITFSTYFFLWASYRTLTQSRRYYLNIFILLCSQCYGTSVYVMCYHIIVSIFFSACFNFLVNFVTTYVLQILKYFYLEFVKSKNVSFQFFTTFSLNRCMLLSVVNNLNNEQKISLTISVFCFL
jgi:hypothetical protein